MNKRRLRLLPLTALALACLRPAGAPAVADTTPAVSRTELSASGAVASDGGTAAAIAHAHEWKEVHRDELVTVYGKEIEGSDVLAVKGVGTLNAPIGKILTVVLDAAHRSEWMEQVKEVRVLREISPTERIEYFVISPPWPIRDRDLIIHETVDVNPRTRTVTVRMKSIVDPAYPPREDRIRAELYDASFIASPAGDGSKTSMLAESHADPKGSIPKWIVNIFQQDMPTHTIRRMLERAHDPAVLDHLFARQLFPAVAVPAF